MMTHTFEEFLEACKQGNLEIVMSCPSTFFLEKNDRGWTGLVVACHAEQYEVAKYLIHQGADVNAMNQKGTTVFMYAKSPVLTSADYRILELLLSAGSDINAKDMFDKTALDYVLEKDNSEHLSQWLTDHGAKKSIDIKH